MPGHGYRSVLIEADGGSRGNPGNAAYGAVLKDAETGAVIAERGERIGVATNNVAEYRGLIEALRIAAERAADEVELKADSELVVRQMSGKYKVRHPDLLPLWQEAKRRALAFRSVEIRHVAREENRAADRIVNRALDLAEAARATEPSGG